MLIALTYRSLGKKYSSLCLNFGGNWQSYIFSINCFLDHLYNRYYNLITWYSLSYWVNNVNRFSEAIWKHIVSDEDGNQIIDIGLVEFRGFAFIDCMGHGSCIPVSGPVNANNDCHEEAYSIQQTLFTRYSKLHGLKSQIVMLPNGMIHHVWIYSVSQNDQGLINLSGREEYMRYILTDACLGYA